MKFTTKIATAAAGLLIASLGIAGCSANPGVSNGKEPVRIGFINLSDGLDFPAAVKSGIQKAAKEHGVDLISCDSNLDAQKALACATSFKSQGVKGILNFQLDTSAAPRICAAGPDVPVVAIDIPQPPCQSLFYGAANYNAGFMSGAVLGKYAKQKFDCHADALLSVNSPAAGQVVIDRENGLISGVQSECPDIKVVHVQTKNGDTDTAITPFRDALTTLPNAKKILVVSSNDEQGVGAIKAATSVNRLDDIYLSSQGGFTLSWPYLCGETDFKHFIATTAYFPDKYGETVVPAMLDLIAGKKLPSTINIEHKVLTPENIREFYPDACNG